MRQISTQSTLADQVTLPHSWVKLPFPNPPPPPLPLPAPSVPNSNAHGRLLVVNDNTSISSDLTNENMGIRQDPYGSPSRGRIIQEADREEESEGEAPIVEVVVNIQDDVSPIKEDTIITQSSMTVFIIKLKPPHSGPDKLLRLLSIYVPSLFLLSNLESV